MSIEQSQDRSALVLVFGILSLIVCAPLGIVAWIMGNADLKAMDEGLMDDRNRSTTHAGRICGIIGTVLAALGVLLVVVYIAFVVLLVGVSS